MPIKSNFMLLIALVYSVIMSFVTIAYWNVVDMIWKGMHDSE